MSKDDLDIYRTCFGACFGPEDTAEALDLVRGFRELMAWRESPEGKAFDALLRAAAILRADSILGGDS